MLVMMAGLTALVDTPMSARSKWALDYGETTCTLSRTFAGEEGDLRLIVRSTPIIDAYNVMVLLPKVAGSGLLQGGMTVSFGGGPSQQVAYKSYPSALGGMRVWRFTMTKDVIGMPGQDAVLTLIPSRGRPVALNLTPTTRAWNALDACGVDLLKRWGVDPEEKAKVARRAEAIGNEAEFLRSEDYPAEAIRAGAQGETRMFFTIGLSGRVTECRVVESSGVEALDRASCAALTRRGRYSPAIGKDGQAMVTHKARSVHWSFPGIWQTDAAYRRIMAEQARSIRMENEMR